MAFNQRIFTQVALGTSGDEYSITVPPDALGLQIRLQQTTGTMKLYTVSVGNGGSPANYITIDSARPYVDRGRCGGQILYLMPSTNSLVAEIAWNHDV